MHAVVSLFLRDAPLAEADGLAIERRLAEGLERHHALRHVGVRGEELGHATNALPTVLVLLEVALPKIRPYLPSPTGIGLGLILPFQYPLSMFLGALIGWLWNRSNPKSADDYLVPMAAGLIAGVSLMGVIVAVLNNIVLAS